MHAKVFSATTVGINAHIVEVEADLALGMLQFFIVGLPDKAIKESKERIKAALKNSGLSFPERLITVNLAPATLKKQDILFDVPIAISILQASNVLKIEKNFLLETLFLGELSLDGSIKGVNGVLSIVHGALLAKKKRVIIPVENVQEARLIKDIEVIGVCSLIELIKYLNNEKHIEPLYSNFSIIQSKQHHEFLDFNEVKGQKIAKRALQIAAAGRHNILFIGPPGSGKSMLAKRLSTILPPMSFDEVIETTKIYSVANQLKKEGLVLTRPFRSPHHTISQAGLVGGGTNPKPGEISLAHNGILFLDELTEFSRKTLEVLREPLENKNILISRAVGSITYPASFLLIAALNPCPCGFYGDTKKKCSCTMKQIKHYLAKLSGPLLDRIDLHVNVGSVDYQQASDENINHEESSIYMQEKVTKAFKVQQERKCYNAFFSTQEITRYCIINEQGKYLLQQAFEKLSLSMRGYHKILKIARTIADIEESIEITEQHIREAIMFRSLDTITHI